MYTYMCKCAKACGPTRRCAVRKCANSAADLQASPLPPTLIIVYSMPRGVGGRTAGCQGQVGSWQEQQGPTRSSSIAACSRQGAARGSRELPAATWGLPEAAGSSQEQQGAARSSRELPGAARMVPVVGRKLPGAPGSCQQQPGRHQEQQGAARSS